MDWDKEALKKIEKVPFFVKKRVKEKIEKIAEEYGSSVVTLKIFERLVALMKEVGKPGERLGALIERGKRSKACFLTFSNGRAACDINSSKIRLEEQL